jgi:N-acetylmuramoyl-L-alanine amidase
MISWSQVKDHLRALKIVLMCVLVFLSAACASMPPLPTSTFQLDHLDTSPLKGRKIVIDPGHGGKYGGAVGKMGLKESEVNLGVALYLWGLLKSAGAQPILTRTADSTVAPPAQAKLGDDLLARSTISNNANPDAFISIHHNSNVNDPQKNNLEVYYQMADAASSMELAESIMDRIKTTFAIEKAQVLPGNYSVLRKTKGTAILGEASYLTHRENERRLSLHGFLKLEAEAYFMGILDYFSRGVPKVVDLVPNGITVIQGHPEVTALIRDDVYSMGIDPATISLYLDGVRVKHFYDHFTGRLTFIPARPLTNREHRLRLEVRNRGGNSARPARAVFKVALPPARLDVSTLFSPIAADGVSRTRVTATVLDENHNPVADGTRVTFSTSAGRIVDTEVATREGLAVTHLISAAQRESAEVVATSGDCTSSCTVTFDDPERKIIEVYLSDERGNPLEGAEFLCGNERCCVTDRLGFCFYPLVEEEPVPFTIWKDGYRSLNGSFAVPVEPVLCEKMVVEAVAGGFWWDKVIVLDPRSEYEETASNSSRADERTEANTKTAQFLREMLKLAGAQVFLTRKKGVSFDLLTKVIKAGEVNAHIFVSIDHSKDSYLGHYFSSYKGKLLARSIKQALEEELSCKKIKLKESTDFVLVHTSMPAVVANLDRRHCKQLPPDEEERAWKEAQVLYQGLRSYFEAIAP